MRKIEEAKPEYYWVEDDYNYDNDSCYCSTSRMPPCNWCTSPDRVEDDFLPKEVKDARKNATIDNFGIF